MTLGGSGAVLATEEGIWYAPSPMLKWSPLSVRVTPPRPDTSSRGSVGSRHPNASRTPTPMDRLPFPSGNRRSAARSSTSRCERRRRPLNNVDEVSERTTLMSNDMMTPELVRSGSQLTVTRTPLLQRWRR